MSNSRTPTAQPITFCQEPLFSGGATQVSIEWNLHLDGPGNLMTFGYCITHTSTGETIEMGTLGATSIHTPAAQLVHILDALLERALRELLPF